jgi:hypothetical protein
MDRIESWQRISAKRIRAELREAQNPSGNFDFEALARELQPEAEPEEPDE